MRRWFVITAVILVLAVTGDALLWRFATQRLQTGLDDWVAAQRSAGWTVSLTAPQTGGWPLAASLAVHDVAIQGARRLVPSGVAWRTDRVVLRISVLRPFTLQIDASGTGHLRVGGGPDVAYSAGRLIVGVPLQAGGAPPALDVLGEALAVNWPDRPVVVEHLTARIALAPAAKQNQAGLSVSLDAAGIGLPGGIDWAFGPRIASLALDAALDGPLPDGPLPQAGGITEHAITWRDDGGALEVRRLDTAWGPLRLHGTARLVLDPALQPAGSGDARIAGYDATADALAAHGVMAPSAAIAAKAVLSLLARAPDGGGPSEVDVPLTLRHRTLSMRQVPLVRMPELDWPRQ